jgi:hypothetical protein
MINKSKTIEKVTAGKHRFCDNRSINPSGYRYPMFTDIYEISAVNNIEIKTLIIIRFPVF